MPIAESIVADLRVRPRQSILMVISGVIFCVPVCGVSEDISNTDLIAEILVRRAFSNLYADDYLQTIRLTTYPRSGTEMARTIQVARKQSGDSGKALLRFIDPPFMKGTSILILETSGNADDLYVYLPAARRTRHVTSSQRGDAFFGTDLAYEDIEPKRVHNYELRHLDACSTGNTPAELVELRPRRWMNSIYEKLVACIEEQRESILWIDFYRGDTRIKRLDVDSESIKRIGLRFVPFSMTMHDLRRGSRTVIETREFSLQPALPEGLFSTRNLEVGNWRRDRVIISGEATD